MVKDLRTNEETNDVQAVMDGALDPFIDASLRQGVDSPAPTPIPDPMASESTPPPSFVKQAMRNMVRKGSKTCSLRPHRHGFLGFITLVAWRGRPTVPG